ncbi:hypothetical protein QR90_05055 [Deinococcus radiopugnans]|uniref:DUF2726 domain-containing protein n=1 Tax=Deinococcus radiopugnans TaxID=57497 RepID=A0A0A7KER4_9DEIO|nr:DUF2726 domain-containing protein [Deinococcus radiopugnans]AIZ44595.1 hypothetical protein QR90_05055 [Deinococcus radiopugnans]
MTSPVPVLSHAKAVTPLRQPGRVMEAAGRYQMLELYQRRLLAALAAHQGEVPNDVVAAAVKMPPGVTWGRMVRLCELGMARQSRVGWALEEAVADLARQDLKTSVHVALILPQPDLLRLPCDSLTERRVYTVCLALFAGCPVLPNVPLTRVIDAEAASPFLDASDQRFLTSRGAALDVVVLGAGLMPVLAIEADGPQHDMEPQLGRDARKNRICRVAGLPLARVRVRQQMSEDVLAHHLGRALASAARDARMGQRGHEELALALSRLV